MKMGFLTLFMIKVFSLSADSPVINSIKISGLKRTKEKVVRDLIKPVTEESSYSEETDEFIIQKLREAGIFNPEILIDVKEIENRVDLEIFLKDRWTLIPIPIVSIGGNGSWKAGILGIEGNLLGLNKTLGLGFFAGSDGLSLLSFFSNPFFLQKDLTLSASLSAGLDDTSDLYANEDILREYQSDTMNLGLGLEYALKKNLFLKGSWEYNYSKLRKDQSPGLEIPDLESTGFTGEIKWKDLYYDIPYEKGILAKTSYTWNLGLGETDSYPSLEAAFTGSFTPWGGLSGNDLIQATLRTAWGELPVQKEIRLGGTPGTLILPMNKIPVDEFSSSMLSYNLPVWTFKGGILSAKAFYEAGQYKSDSIEREFYYGPGGGLELFINNLAIPAVQMNLGYNNKTGLYQFSAGIGMGGGNPD